MNRLMIFAFVLLASVLSGQESRGNAQAPVSLSSERLAAHAYLPQHNPPGISLRRQLADARAQAPSRGILTWNGLNIAVTDHELLSPSASVATLLLQHYAGLSCTADAIVSGRPRSSIYRLSASETGIYGDYLFSIETVLKNNAVSPLNTGAEMVITRPGGSLVLPEGPVSMRFRAYPELQENTTYWLFLRYISASSAYTALDPFSTLLLDINNNWTITRSAFSSERLPELGRGTFETKIADWRKTCK